METTLSPGRWRQIAIANFDYYVETRFAEPSWIVTIDGIDKRELGCLANAIGCNPLSLRSIIAASVVRNSRNDKLILNEIQDDGEKEIFTIMAVSEKEEEDLIKNVLKFNIKESIIPLTNVRRKLGRMPHILNHQNADLKVSIHELSAFIIPLYKEAIDESLTF